MTLRPFAFVTWQGVNKSWRFESNRTVGHVGWLSWKKARRNSLVRIFRIKGKIRRSTALSAVICSFISRSFRRGGVQRTGSAPLPRGLHKFMGYGQKKDIQLIYSALRGRFCMLSPSSQHETVFLSNCIGHFISVNAYYICVCATPHLFGLCDGNRLAWLFSLEHRITSTIVPFHFQFSAGPT